MKPAQTLGDEAQDQPPLQADTLGAALFYLLLGPALCIAFGLGSFAGSVLVWTFDALLRDLVWAALSLYA